MRKLILRILLYSFLSVIALFVYSFKTNKGRRFWYPLYARFFRYSVSERLQQYGDAARSRYVKAFADQKITYPNCNLSFVILKQERMVEVWAQDSKMQKPGFIKRYGMTAFSGRLGPKLREGDYQIPEGFYRISGLNPNSSYHLSLKLNYPNKFDVKHAQAEGRKNPGTLIFIHGKNVSIGCVALGDQAIEEVFTMVADAGKENVKVIISPLDFRKAYDKTHLVNEHQWVSQLYAHIETKLLDDYQIN